MSSTDEEELNIESEKFNPLKAITSTKFKLPEDVKPLDNVAKLESRLKTAGGNFEEDLTVNKMVSKKDPTQTEVVDEEKYHVTKLGRVFQKEQAPVTKPKPARYTKNVLTKMEKETTGPLALLKKYCDNKTRVKVYVRKKTGIRGYVTGFIEVFDKHFNLALRDCVEIWRRKKHYFSENKVCRGQPKDCSEMLARMGITIPTQTVKSLGRKHVEISRKIPQIMIRGEQVILVTTDPDISSNPDSKKSPT